MLQESWFESCKAGDASAWDRLRNRFARLVYSIPRRMGLSGDACDDVSQDTFLSLYQHLGSIKDASSLPGWLVTTARRYALRQRERLIREVPLDGALSARVHENGHSALDALCANSLKAQMLTAMTVLPETNRQLLHMLYYEDQSYAKVASSLGCPIGSIGPVRRRSLERLRKELCGSSAQSQSPKGMHPATMTLRSPNARKG